jgi:hypothetical protein
MTPLPQKYGRVDDGIAPPLLVNQIRAALGKGSYDPAVRLIAEI